MADDCGLGWLYSFFRLTTDFVHANVMAFVGRAAGYSDAYPRVSNVALFASIARWNARLRS